jgi:hypothetical protein
METILSSISFQTCDLSLKIKLLHIPKGMVKIHLKKGKTMKRYFVLTVLIGLFGIYSLSAQTKTEEDMNVAYQNAKKGIYWALENIPGKKASLDNDLIAEDKLYASVKISKEVQGVKVSSKGYNNTNEVEITIYKSYESLKAEGYNVPNTGWED